MIPYTGTAFLLKCLKELQLMVAFTTQSSFEL